MIATLWLRGWSRPSVPDPVYDNPLGNGWWDHGKRISERRIKQRAGEPLEQFVRRLQESFLENYGKTIDVEYDASYRNVDTGEEYTTRYRTTGRWVVP